MRVQIPLITPELNFIKLRRHHRLYNVMDILTCWVKKGRENGSGDAKKEAQRSRGRHAGKLYSITEDLAWQE